MPELLGCSYIRPQKILPVTAIIIQPNFYCQADMRDLKAVKPLHSMRELTFGWGFECAQVILHASGEMPEHPRFVSAFFGDLWPMPPGSQVERSGVSKPNFSGWISSSVQHSRINLCVYTYCSQLAYSLPSYFRMMKTIRAFVKKCKNCSLPPILQFQLKPFCNFIKASSLSNSLIIWPLAYSTFSSSIFSVKQGRWYKMEV